MRIRLGYVAMALKLEKVTSSSTVTYRNYIKQGSEENKLNKLKQVTLTNLDDLYRILQYTVRNNIHFYRITSALIPLATHPEVTNWDYRKIFDKDFERLANFIRDNDIRVDIQPNEFNVINSSKEEVLKNTEINLLHHLHIFEDLNYPLGKMVMHIGTKEGGKETALDRFVKNYNNYPLELKSKFVFQNDDKTFTTKEVLTLCQEIKAPMVLDVQHHNCNSGGDELEPMLSDIFSTWKDEPLPPKLHFSSPKDTEKDRKHADYINAEDFACFIEKCIPLGFDLDIMLESKQKDLALYKLVQDIKEIRPLWEWVDRSTLEL